MNEARALGLGQRRGGPSRPDDDGPDLNRVRPLSAHQVYEVIRREGEEELERDTLGLFMSGLAAGIAIAASIQGKMMLAIYLPDEPWALLVQHTAYPVGFLLVICGRLQLFTEHTITAVTPVACEPSFLSVLKLLRLWALVLAANLIGATFAAWFTVSSGAFDPGAVETLLSLSPGMEDQGFAKTMIKGIGAGFLIAALVWLLPSVRSSQVAAIFVVTYLIALCDFSHVIASSVEVMAHVIAGRDGLGEAIYGYILPSLAGNVIGGTTLFTLLVYSQVRNAARGETTPGRG
ncbi:MAG: formate/nitrite transporter family protein [Paracoccaceae bacterium]